MGNMSLFEAVAAKNNTNYEPLPLDGWRCQVAVHFTCAADAADQRSLLSMQSLSEIDVQRITLEMENKQVRRHRQHGAHAAQLFIMRLTAEIDRKAASVKQLSTVRLLHESKQAQQGQELLARQAENRTLIERASELRRTLAETIDADQARHVFKLSYLTCAQVQFDTHELQQMPRDELVRAYIDLSHRYATEIERATEYQSRIQSGQVLDAPCCASPHGAQNMCIASNDVERQLMELERRHRDESAAVQQVCTCIAQPRR